MGILVPWPESHYLMFIFMKLAKAIIFFINVAQIESNHDEIFILKLSKSNKAGSLCGGLSSPEYS